MKVYLMSLGAGLLVGVIYSMMNVRSPAPPVIALISLLGISSESRSRRCSRASGRRNRRRSPGCMSSVRTSSGTCRKGEGTPSEQAMSEARHHEAAPLHTARLSELHWIYPAGELPW